MTRYCFDSDALMMSWRTHYSPDLFKSLWEKLGSLIEEGRILIPDEVKKEIGEGKDPLVDWIKRHHNNLASVNSEQIDIVSEIVNKYPLVSQYKKPRPYHADPFVIAVAKLNKCIVVTYEVPNGSTDHPHIPDLCKEHNLECISLPDFFKKENLRFDLQQ